MSWNNKLRGFLTFLSFAKVISENQSNSRRGKGFKNTNRGLIA